MDNYDVYVSINNINFLPWLQNTRLNNAVYQGIEGVTYYFFSRATDQAGNLEPAPTAADAMTTVSLEEEAMHWQLNLSAQPSSAGELSGDGMYEDGQAATIEANAHPGWRFAYCQGSGIGNQEMSLNSVIMDRDRIVNAVFVKTWNLTATTSNTVHGNVSGSGNYDDGSAVAIQAIPAESYLFSHWDGPGVNDVTNKQTTVSLSGDQEVQAVFKFDTTSSYDIWSQAEFKRLSQVEEVAGKHANPDGDCAVNLLEMAFGMDPHVADCDRIPHLVSGDVPGEYKLVFHRLKSGGGLTYHIQEASTPDGNWTTFNASPDETFITSVSPTLERVEITFDASYGASSRYFRIRISCP